MLHCAYFQCGRFLLHSTFRLSFFESKRDLRVKNLSIRLNFNFFFFVKHVLFLTVLFLLEENLMKKYERKSKFH